MGVSYKGGAPSYYSIKDNVNSLKKTFEYNDGYFGKPGKNYNIRVIYSKNPIEEGKKFYKKISYGGIEKDLTNGKGKITHMVDGTIITFRLITKSNNYPGIDINISKSRDSCGIKMQKIHFEKGDDRK